MRSERDELSSAVIALGNTKRLGFYVWDVESDRVVSCRTTAALYGLDGNEARLGLPVATLIGRIHSDDQDRMRTATLKGELGSFSYEYRIARAPDDVVRVRTCGCRFHEDGAPPRHVGTIAPMDMLRANSTDAVVDYCLADYEIAEASGKRMVQHLLAMALMELGFDLAKH